MFIGTSPRFRSATVVEDHKDQSEYCERFSSMTNSGEVLVAETDRQHLP
jgi:hypothetical protein